MNLRGSCKKFVLLAIFNLKSGGIFAFDFDKTNDMKLLMNISLLGILFGLLAAVGIAIFFVACWKTLKKKDDE